MEEERVSTWRWGLYIVALLSSGAVAVVGAISERSEGWLKGLIVLYIIWGVSFGLFALSVAERSPKFLIRCLYYLFWIGLTCAFFGSLRNASSDNVQFWMPASTTIGVFVGVGAGHCWSMIKINSRELILRLLGEGSNFPPDYRPRSPQESLLPRYENQTLFSISPRSSLSITSFHTAAAPSLDYYRPTIENHGRYGELEETPWTAEH